MLFDALLGTFHLGALAPHLPPKCEVRFLACQVAAKATMAGKSWHYEPKQALAWLSARLGKRKVWAPKVDVLLGDFGDDGFLTSSDVKLMASP